MIVSKLPQVGTTIFTVMSKLAAESGAINLGQGFPGFPVDERLVELVARAMRDGHNQYAPMPGVPALRERIARKMATNYGMEWDPDSEITVTAGGTQAIYTAITASIRPGDEVILFAPAYDCYAPAVEVNGGKPVWIELLWPDYSIPWDQVRARITPRTRMIVINSPHNPSGTILTRSDLLELQAIAEEYDLLVVSDEVYEHIVFDGRKHESCARYPALARRSFIVYSFGKTFHATGWKLGYVVAPKVLSDEFRKVHQYLVFSCNSALQVALAHYMEDPAVWQGLPDFYQAKRDRFLQLLEGSRFRWKPAAGTYFQLLGFSDISREPDTQIARQWTASHKVASIPVSVFYPSGADHHVLRLCFAKTDDQLEQAAAILRTIE